MTPAHACKFRVIGTPSPQGSKKHVGRGVLVESCKALKPWRDSIVSAARENGVSVPGPVHVRLTFTMPRPASAPKKRIYPDRKPDLDKLVRAVFDALKTAGVIEDDARVVSLHTYKFFPTDVATESADALDVPGVVVRVSGAL